MRSAPPTLAAHPKTSPVLLRVIGEVSAGAAATTAVEPGTAIRIATGAPVPPGADAVVQVELTTPADATGTATGPRGRDATGAPPPTVLVHAAIEPGAAIRRRGSDLAEGVDHPRARPGAVGRRASRSRRVPVSPQVSVYPRPRIAVLATGDEVVPAGEPLGPAGIPDANGPGLAALVEAAGGDAEPPRDRPRHGSTTSWHA